MQQLAQTFDWRVYERFLLALSVLRSRVASYLRCLAKLVDVEPDAEPRDGYYAPDADSFSFSNVDSFLLAMPPDILHSILSYCDARSLSVLDRSCRSLHATDNGMNSPVERAVKEVETREYSEAAGFMRLKQSAPARLRWLEEAERQVWHLVCAH